MRLQLRTSCNERFTCFVTFFLSSPLDIPMYITNFVVVPQFLDIPFCVFISLFLFTFGSFWFVVVFVLFVCLFYDFIDISSNLEIFSSLVSSLLVSSSKVFFNSVTVIFFLFFYFFFYFWLCWVFVSVRGLSLVVASGGHSSLRCMGLSPPRPLPLWSTGSRRTGSVVVAHRPSRSVACGIFPDRGMNPCPLHWQADSQPLRHQGSPCYSDFNL